MKKNLLVTLLAFAGAAQAQFPFELTIQQGANSQVVPNGANIGLPATSQSQPATLTLVVQYTGTATATLSAATVLGSTEFTVSNPTSFPVMSPGDQVSFGVTFTPSNGNSITAQLTIPYSLSTGSSTSPTTGSVSLNLIGTAPNFVLSYFVEPNDNVVPLADGGTIQFPSTPVGTTGIAALVISNTGSGAGAITSLTPPGAPFSLADVPLLPGSIASGATLQIGVLYTPVKAGADSATMQLVLGPQTLTFNIAGTGAAPQLQYEFLQGNETSTVIPSGTFTVMNTNVGSTTTVSVTATNAGTANAVVTSIGVTGQGFQLTDAPPLPQTVAPTGFITVTFTFTPPQAGSFTGRLRIGTDTFTLVGTGIGALLQYSYTAGSASASVLPNGTVVLAPAQVGQSSSTTFTVNNAGTASATLANIAVLQAKSPFSVSALPPLPVTLEPGQSTNFQITFQPTTTAGATATLQVDSQQFQLSGSGNAPGPLSAYSFTGSSGTVGPMQQPAVGLTLAAPYPAPITGTLVMTVDPAGFTADPAIQFSTGGRSASFTIAANATQAVFSNGSTSIQLQTGSTAGTITLTPSFALSGGVDLTPANPTTVQFSVPAVAPIILGAEVTAASGTSITLAITAVSNSLDLSELDFTFTAAPGYTLTNTAVKLPVTSEALAWFQGSGPLTYGGQFIATVIFNFTTTTKSLTSPAVAIQSVSMTATNEQGVSAPVSVALQ